MIKQVFFTFLFSLIYLSNIAQVDSIDLQEVVVSSEDEIYKEKLLPSSVITLTIDDVLKLPATFFDPARLAQKYAGVANTNDQANSISIRGTNPDYLKYFMEGVEIVNPNHLSNAGTFNDQPTSNAGGVNILSAQLLNTTQLYKSNYPMMFSNALSGVMSMSLRPGSFQENKHFAQAGLIGLEVGSEGPLNKKKNTSYLANYRFSTVGLLAEAGLDFGGETISFQDFSFNISRLTKKGLIKFFGIGGLSRNIFEGTADPNSWEENKDRFDIDYSNAMAAAGVSLSMRDSEGVSQNVSIVLSALNSSRSSSALARISSFEELFNSTYRQLAKVGLQYSMFYTDQKGNEIKTGTQVNYDIYEIDDFRRISTIEERYWQANLFFHFATNPKKIGQFSIGARAKNIYIIGLDQFEFNFEPKISYRYLLSSSSKLICTAGLYSQLDPIEIYSVQTFSATRDTEISQSKSANFVLASEKVFKNNVVMSVELFYHHLYDIPTDVLLSSTINQEIPSGIIVRTTNAGRGRSFGVEVNFDKRESNGFYYQTNGTLYDSKFRFEKGNWMDTRFNGNYILNGTIGKSWEVNKKAKKKLYGLNASLNYAGGLRERMIDELSSEGLATTLFLDSRYTLQARDYFRVDFSAYVKTTINNFNGRLSLDIQNVLNKRNEGFAFYDPVLQGVQRQEQLGILPVLNYRINF